MKLAEILRKIADVVDQQEISATQPVQVRAVAILAITVFSLFATQVRPI